MSLPLVGGMILAVAIARTLGGLALRLVGTASLWLGALGLMVGGGPAGLALIVLGVLLWSIGRVHRRLRGRGLGSIRPLLSPRWRRPAAGAERRMR
jgi:Na+/H+ antiporter NhaC